MKVASKVFILISIIACSISEIYFIGVGLYSDDLSYSAVGLFLFTLIPIVVGACSLYRLSICKNKKDLIVVGILTIIFCSVLGGAFMLGIPDNEFEKKSSNTNTYYNKTNDEDTAVDYSNQSLEIDNDISNQQKNLTKQQDLATLKDLYDNGVINQDEYKTAALKIINKKY